VSPRRRAGCRSKRFETNARNQSECHDVGQRGLSHFEWIAAEIVTIPFEQVMRIGYRRTVSRVAVHGSGFNLPTQSVEAHRRGSWLWPPPTKVLCQHAAYVARESWNPNLPGASRHYRGKELRSFPASRSEAGAVSSGANYSSQTIAALFEGLTVSSGFLTIIPARNESPSL
jgi:hypothetical protein